MLLNLYNGDDDDDDADDWWCGHVEPKDGVDQGWTNISQNEPQATSVAYLENGHYNIGWWLCVYVYDDADDGGDVSAANAATADLDADDNWWNVFVS